MPRGFLVKRASNQVGTYASWRQRYNSGDEFDRQSDSGSEQENNVFLFSPGSMPPMQDKPLSLTTKDIIEKDISESLNNNNDASSTSSIEDLSTTSTQAREEDEKKNLLNNNATRHASLISAAELFKAKTAMLMHHHPGLMSPPLSISPSYPSPFFFPTFDKLSMTSPQKQSPGSMSSAASIRSCSTPGSNQASPRKRPADTEPEVKPKITKKTKAMRKINYTEADKSSPVSGTIIKQMSDNEENGARLVCGDIEPSLNMVEVTPEARAELAKITNKIGAFVCKLCKEFYSDAFGLAQHKCSCIVHVEYRCPECDKVFNCPANLASHRRWHKPRVPGQTSKVKTEGGERKTTTSQSDGADTQLYSCPTCAKKFRRQAYLRKHMATHNSDKTKKSEVQNNSSAKIPVPVSFKSATISVAPGSPASHSVYSSPSSSSSEKESLRPSIRAPLGALPQMRTTGPMDLPCSSCPATFPSHALLERHLNLDHTNDVHECKYCTSMFYSTAGLARHMGKAHPDVTAEGQPLLLGLPVSRPC